jgi:hypothetical protein
VERDVAALAAMRRESAVDEAATAAWLAERLPGAEVQPYDGRTTFAWANAALAAAGFLARPLWARAALLAALELDASGRAPLPLGRARGANVVARVAPSGEQRRTLVLLAHHDTQHASVVWAPALHRPGAARRLKTRSIPPYLGLAGLALALRFRPLLALLLGLSVEQAVRGPVPGANDNATGVAAVLALMERYAAQPFEHTEVVAALVGGEEAGMLGSRAFFRRHRFDPETTLVLSLDTLGCGTPIVLEAEHALIRHRYADRDLALVPEDVERWTIGGWTDALQAKFAGLRALSLLSIGPEGIFTHYHHASDLPEHVDFACVRACVDVAAQVADRWDATPGR